MANGIISGAGSTVKERWKRLYTDKSDPISEHDYNGV
jgi:hypothetical protein